MKKMMCLVVMIFSLVVSLTGCNKPDKGYMEFEKSSETTKSTSVVEELVVEGTSDSFDFDSFVEEFGKVENASKHSFAYVDIFTGDKSYHNDRVIESREMLNLFIATAFYQAVNDEVIPFNEEYSFEDGTAVSYNELVRLMIEENDMLASETLIEILGVDYINTSIQNGEFLNTKLDNSNSVTSSKDLANLLQHLVIHDAIFNTKIIDGNTEIISMLDNRDNSVSSGYFGIIKSSTPYVLVVLPEIESSLLGQSLAFNR